MLTMWVPTSTQAVEFNIQSETSGDFYELVTSDDQILQRRRLHQYLGFGAYDLLGDQTYSLSLVTLFRFDADFGIEDEEKEQIDKLRDLQLSVQVAYLRGRDLAGGLIDFDAGRFLHSDAIDFLLLDGARVTVKTPWYFGVELIGGLETKNDQAAINSTQLELDGVRFIEGQVENEETTVAVGAALVTTDLWNTRARFGYRRLFSDGEVDQEKIGLSFYQRIAKVVHLDLSGSYDFYNGYVDRAQAGVRAHLGDAFEVYGQFVRLLPSFDADSIFNIFTSEPLNDANLKFTWHLSQTQRMYVGGNLRFFGNEQGADEGDATVDTSVKAVGGRIGWAERFGEEGRLSTDVSIETGYGGMRALLDVWGTWGIVPGRWELDARLTGVIFDNDLQPNLESAGGGYSLGGRYILDRKFAASLVAEHNFNKLYTSQFRMMVLVDVNLWL